MVQENVFVLMLQSVAALALVLALFAALVWGLRKLQFRHLPQGEKAMRVVQRLAIDSRHSVIEIEHGAQRYLLGVSPAGISTIADSLAAPPASTATGIDSAKPDNQIKQADANAATEI